MGSRASDLQGYFTQNCEKNKLNLFLVSMPIENSNPFPINWTVLRLTVPGFKLYLDKFQA